MDTSDFVESPGRRTHRRHSAEFKAQVIRACGQPGVSVASVALANGLNANMLRRWLSETGRADLVVASGQGAVAARAAPVASANTSSLPAFVAVQMPAPLAVSAELDIRIEFTRGPTMIVMCWPSSLAGACASCLREMLR